MPNARKPRPPSLRLRAPRAPELLERVEQERLIYRARIETARYPCLALLWATPNGGLRNPREAVSLQRQGVKPGVPDLTLAVPLGGYAGWFCELKRTYSGQLSPEQAETILALREQGYWACWHRGAEEAWADLEWYLSLPAPHTGYALPTRAMRPVHGV